MAIDASTAKDFPKKVTWKTNSEENLLKNQTRDGKVFNADSVVDPLFSNTNHILKQMREKSDFNIAATEASKKRDVKSGG